MSTGGLIQVALGKSFLQWSVLPPSIKNIGIIKVKIHDFANPVWGGTGVVSGTVKIGTVAAKRRVRLYEAGSGVFIRECWSGIDGTYSFTGLKKDYKYTVTATDYAGTYNDVIAANLTPI